jgi:hypothetical protein
MKLTPVTLPPGRLRLATRPSLTGSPSAAKTIGTVVVALGRERRRGIADDYGHRPAQQFGHQRRQSIKLIIGPGVFDRDVLSLDVACLIQAVTERPQEMTESADDVLRRNPITGIAGWCARAASGQPTAAPLSSVKKSRRLRSSMRLPPQVPPPS